MTMLQWSFVRDDQPRAETCEQLALAIRDEVADLEQAGVGSDPGRRARDPRGPPLRRDRWDEYLRGPCTASRVATSPVRDETQVKTHMCYSDFGDIMERIQEMDADVPLIEAARSGWSCCTTGSGLGYDNEIGPGVYDIHSPRVPPAEEMAAAARRR